ncbi:MAG: TraB/GumN family protein [Ferruginibacter sp.]
MAGLIKMMTKRRMYQLLTGGLMLLITMNVLGQKEQSKKYPSLFWEITGNGLFKPSYLFGTMHVSSKMVFHLSDSFYYAMKNVDAVALELNPDLWQGQMVNLDRLKQNYANFIQAPTGDFLTENSFRINKFDTELKSALNSEPTIVNSLLYRSYKAREDFEEDTFLDLYIFQTGKKLGKRSAGVEDYYETEKVVLEAYADMAKEKKKKNVDMEGESFRDIFQKIQDAYRSGDLDLMDSLDLMTERSDAFREKFLYKRNEIQASSIDTIIQHHSLFVGVGAAHLAGPRGIIELLRKMGYTLRPIKMADRDAVKKEETDQLKVPVVFNTIKADDGFYSVSMPGPLFKMKDEYQRLDRRQYSDMSNGSYYLVTRVKTYAAFLGISEDMVMKKIDSLLYENIPGKILKKTTIQKDGYKGFDITNRTRRGDMQRYHIYITPFEVIVFKMSGKENYVDGKEAAQFFSSIQLTETKNTTAIFKPKQGGFSVKFPQQPYENLNTNTSDGINRWEYGSADSVSDDAYLVFKKSVYNFKFLEEDSFDLKLVEESFRSPDYFDKQIERKQGTWQGYPCLDVKEKMKDGSVVTARYILKGPHYYTIAVRSKNNNKDFSSFFNSFRFEAYQYSNTKKYVDTFLHFSVNTPVAPDLDESYRAKLEKVTTEIANSNPSSAYNSYWPKSKNALFTNDSTGETIGVSIQQYPKYYSVKNAAKFWKNEIEDFYNEDDLVLYRSDSFTIDHGIKGYAFSLRDTGSSRMINRMIMLKDNHMFSMVTLGDTSNQQSSFINQFYSSFRPEEKKLGKNIFVSNLDSFFTDLFSKDSLTHAKAEQTISNIYYGEKGASKIISGIHHLQPGKDYSDSKVRLIAELGYIKDTTTRVIVSYLKKIYDQTADTTIFQNEVLKALARHKTSDAIKLFKELVLQDPPFFDNSFDYTGIFVNLGDSLKLAATLFPEILQLAAVEDYKKPIVSLLVTLVDSGLVKGGQYADYFQKLYFDAKIELKKQQGKDEKKPDEEKGKDNDIELVSNFDNNDNNSELNNYSVLLLPFYEKNNNVPKFFDKLLKSKDEEVRLDAVITLLRNDKYVADSILNWFASKDEWRGRLYKRLEKAGQLKKFPIKYKTQLDVARSFLATEKSYKKMDSIAFITKYQSTLDGSLGWVYFFKYRAKKGEDWKIGMSGLQPLDTNKISSNDKLTSITDKKLREDRPQAAQLQEQLKKFLFTLRKSGKNFFGPNYSNYRFSKGGEYQE